MPTHKSEDYKLSAVEYYLTDDILQEVFSFINYDNILHEIYNINKKLNTLFYAEKFNNTFYRNNVQQLVCRKQNIFKKCCDKLSTYHRFLFINHVWLRKLPPKLVLNSEDKKIIHFIINNP